jgi:hypothetical protein
MENMMIGRGVMVTVVGMGEVFAQDGETGNNEFVI